MTRHNKHKNNVIIQSCLRSTLKRTSVMIAVLLIYFLQYSTGQLLSDVFPFDPKTADTTTTEDFPENPLSIMQADLITAALNTLAKLPKALFGHIEEPYFSNPSLQGTDAFFIDFKAGHINEDVNLTFKQLVIKYGYDFEKYEVVTKDGYLLSLFRIPGDRQPVLLMHGLLGSADDFIIAGCRNGLAYLLADAGYDVWLGNARGNKHSRAHVSIKPSKAAFWEFSWHEIGVEDLPPMIDFILEKSNSKTLKYIGHSQGTTAFFVMASVKPEYNKKVSLMIALSPVAYMGFAKSPVVRLLSPGTVILEDISKRLGIYEFLPDDRLTRTLKQIICGTGITAEIICSNTVFLVSGYDFEQLNVSNLPVIFGHLPAGASMKQLAHYAQGIMSEEFREYDYGSMENSERYGTVVPPSYRLSEVRAPVSLFFSDSDWLADKRDVAKLNYKLPNVVDIYRIPYENFNHVDFIIAKDVKTLVYDRVLRILERY